MSHLHLLYNKRQLSLYNNIVFSLSPLSAGLSVPLISLSLSLSLSLSVCVCVSVCLSVCLSLLLSLSDGQ